MKMKNMGCKEEKCKKLTDGEINEVVKVISVFFQNFGTSTWAQKIFLNSIFYYNQFIKKSAVGGFGIENMGGGGGLKYNIFDIFSKKHGTQKICAFFRYQTHKFFLLWSLYKMFKK